jgi:hypothetical protein
MSQAMMLQSIAAGGCRAPLTEGKTIPMSPEPGMTLKQYRGRVNDPQWRISQFRRHSANVQVPEHLEGCERCLHIINGGRIAAGYRLVGK